MCVFVCSPAATPPILIKLKNHTKQTTLKKRTEEMVFVFLDF